MKLVEAESEGPVEGEDAIVTAPRPPHRRVSVSLVFTLSVLIGTVVTIYVVFPARKNVLVEEALAHHRDTEWDVTAPTPAELHAWSIGVVGPGVPVRAPDSWTIVGAKRLHVLNRNAALVRYDVGGSPITYVVQHAHGIAPRRDEISDGDIRAVAWRRGAFSCAAVYPAAKAKERFDLIIRE
jgi:hypothetical protein